MVSFWSTESDFWCSLLQWSWICDGGDGGGGGGPLWVIVVVDLGTDGGAGSRYRSIEEA